ncbi:MAG: BMP family lipoprotein [Bacilli bacterium]
MKKRNLALALTLSLGLTGILAGCGSDSADGGDKKEPKNPDFKVGMVTDMGGVDDKSFNQSTWEGLTAFAKEEGLVENTNYKYLHSAKAADYLTNLTQFAENGFDLTFGVGFLLMGDVEKAATNFPDRNFAIIDSVVNKPNVASIVFKEEQGSFLVGVIAGMTSKTNKVGFIGGVESELIKKFEVGFRAGVKAVNPEAEVFVQYAGAFDKPELGTQIASTLYGKGADIIYHAAGGTGNGVFTEAKNRTKKDPANKVWVIGVDRDQYEEGLPEDVTLTSMVKRVDTAAKDVTLKAYNGEFKGGSVYEYGLENDGIGVSTHVDNVSKDAQAKVEELAKKIEAGEITVPKTEDEFKAFKL